MRTSGITLLIAVSCCVAVCCVWGDACLADIFAVGENGTILRNDGTGWVAVTGVPGWNYTGIWGSSDINIYVAGTPSYHSLLHYDGNSWSEITICDPIAFTYDYQFTDVYGLGENDVYAFGHWLDHPDIYVGCVFHYDGEHWALHLDGFAGTKNKGWVSDDGWVFGTGRAWNASEQWEYAITDAWGPGGERERNPGYSNNHIWGTSHEFVLTPGTHYSPPEGYRTNVLVFDYSYWRLLYWDDTFMPPSFNMPWYLHGVWGTSETDIFFVGGDGAIVHFDGYRDGLYTHWTPMTSGTTEHLMAVWGSAGDAVFAVGAGGTILYYNGISWSPLTSGTTEMLCDVWGAPGGVVATLLHGHSVDVGVGGVVVSWTLASYDEKDRFNVIRIGEQEEESCALDPAGIERRVLQFSFTDRTAQAGGTYRYRVDVTQGDRTNTLFETKPVTVPAAAVVLQQNYPNPFNPLTTLRYHVPESGPVSLTVYDVSGRQVTVLVDAVQDSGWHTIDWDGRNELGHAMSSGVYYCCLRTGKTEVHCKMVLTR